MIHSPLLEGFLLGVIATSSVVAGIFFLRFWKDTRDSLFLAFASLFFAALGRAPGALLLAMLDGAFGSGYALSETLVKTAPILLCALGTVLPARLGLISVGAEGQLFVGAISGTAFVLGFGDTWGRLTLPAMLLAGAAGRAA